MTKVEPLIISSRALAHQAWVNTEEFSQLKLSWCDGAMAIGPENNPTLVTGQATITQPVDFVMVWSQNTASWISVNSGVADRWLFDDSGVTPDAVMDIGPHTYAYRSITPTNDVTVKYDCMADRDCLVTLQGESSSPRMLAICVGCYANQESALAYRGGVDGDLLRFVTGPVLSSAEFNTFTVRYNNGYVTVYRNDAKIPIYAVDVPHPITNINIIGIGGLLRSQVRPRRPLRPRMEDGYLDDGGKRLQARATF